MPFNTNQFQCVSLQFFSSYMTNYYEIQIKQPIGKQCPPKAFLWGKLFLSQSWFLRFQHGGGGGGVNHNRIVLLKLAKVNLIIKSWIWVYVKAFQKYLYNDEVFLLSNRFSVSYFFCKFPTAKTKTCFLYVSCNVKAFWKCQCYDEFLFGKQ